MAVKVLPPKEKRKKQELEFCEKTDKDAINNLSRGIRFFDDSFLALQAVKDPGYKIAEKTYPHREKEKIVVLCNFYIFTKNDLTKFNKYPIFFLL